MAEIGINNLTHSKIDENFVKRVAKIVLKGENKKEAGLSVVFFNRKRMRELNKKHRGKYAFTDVLSFGQGLNEIVVCPEEVKKNAGRFNLTFKKELAQTLIHGILHILGYNHSEIMKKKQNQYLNLLKL